MTRLKILDMTVLLNIYKLYFNIVKYAIEQSVFDSGVSLLLQYPALSELLPREVLEVNFFSHR